MTEATHFSQCVHDQQRRLEADSIRCAQLISGGRRRIRPPCTVPRSRSPTMRCVRLVNKSTSKRTKDIGSSYSSDRDRTVTLHFALQARAVGAASLLLRTWGDQGRGAPYRTVSRPGNEANIFVDHYIHPLQ